MGSSYSIPTGPLWLPNFLTTPYPWAWLYNDPIDALLANIMRLEVGDALHNLVVDDAMADAEDDLMDGDSAGSSDEEDDTNRLEYEPNEEEADQRHAELNALIRREMSRAARMFRLKLLVVCVLLCTNLGKDFSQYHNPSFSDLMGWTTPEKEDDDFPVKTSRIPRLFGTLKPMGDLSEYFPDIKCKPEYPVLFGYPPLICYSVEKNMTSDPTHNTTYTIGNTTGSFEIYNGPLSAFHRPRDKPYLRRRFDPDNAPWKRLIMLRYRRNITRRADDQRHH